MESIFLQICGVGGYSMGSVDLIIARVEMKMKCTSLHSVEISSCYPSSVNKSFFDIIFRF